MLEELEATLFTVRPTTTSTTVPVEAEVCISSENANPLPATSSNNNKVRVHYSLVKAQKLHRYYSRYWCPQSRTNVLVQMELIMESNSNVVSKVPTNQDNNLCVNETIGEIGFKMEDENDIEILNNNAETRILFGLTGARLVIKLSSTNQQMDLSQDSHIFLFLSMPCGKYPVEMYQHQRRLQVPMEYFLHEWIYSMKLYSYSSSICIDLNSIPEIKHAFFIGAPLLLKSLDKFRTFLKFAVCQWIMDDFMIKSVNSGQIPFLSPMFFNDLKKIVNNIFSCEYRHVDAVPYFEIPLFHHCLVALFLVHQEIREAVGWKQYEKFHASLLKEMTQWIEWHKINAYTFVGGGRYFSQGTNFTRVRFLRGRGALLEIIQLLHGATLEDSLRRLKDFELLYDSAVVINTMTMETFSGIKTKVSQSEIDAINDGIVDFQRIAQNLQRQYASSDRVLRFIKNAQCFVDGGIRAVVEDWKRGVGLTALVDATTMVQI